MIELVALGERVNKNVLSLNINRSMNQFLFLFGGAMAHDFHKNFYQTGLICTVIHQYYKCRVFIIHNMMKFKFFKHLNLQ